MGGGGSGGLRIEALSGDALAQRIPALGRVRSAVFRAWPYLYDGDAEREAAYLRTYVQSRRAAVFVAWDGDAPVGMSTCLPLADETPNVAAPFVERGISPERVFYFGESVLLPEYRGRGVGVQFFHAREARARDVPDCDFTAFCAVQRPLDHPARPPDAEPLDAFWRRRGYTQRPDLVCTMRWRDVGDAEESDHRLTFWLRSLTGAPLP